VGDVVLQVAAKAVIVNDDGQVLILREAAAYDVGTKAGRYQLPGGRIHPGEAFYDALAREVKEETGLEITSAEPLLVGEWRPVVKGEQWQIIGMFIHCRVKGSAEVHVSEEHDDAQWINPSARAAYDIVEPDWMAIDALAKT
jgi:8-oxo-dGTP diphosphatase